MELIKRIFVFATCTDMQTAQFLINTVRSDNSLLRINLSKIRMAHAIRRNLT